MKKKLKQRREMGGTRGEAAILNNQVRPFGENDVLAKTDHVNIWHARCRGKDKYKGHIMPDKFKGNWGSQQEQKKQGVSRRQHGQKQGARLPWAVVRKAANELREMGIIGGFQTTSQQRSVNMHWIWIGLFWLQN